MLVHTSAAPSVAGAPPRRHAGLILRIVSALVAAPLVLGATLAGGPWFVILVLVVTSIATWELNALQRKANIPAYPWVALTASWAFPLAAAVHETGVGTALLGIAIVGGLLQLGRAMPTLSQVFGAADQSEFAGDATLGLAGWGLAVTTGLYVGALLAPSIVLRERPDGLIWIALILAGTWVCDIAAYFVGRQWGTHRLAPSISPQKSIEGTLAGMAAAVVACSIGGALVGDWGLRYVGLGLVIAWSAVGGDLAESVLKRHLGAKDSGWIMPGHGGLLDRIDGLLFSSFFAYWFVTLSDVLAPR